MKNSKLTRLALGMLSTVLFAACSGTGNNGIKGVDLSTETKNGVVIADLTAHLDANNFQVAYANLLYYNPKKPSEILGEINVSSTTPGITDVKFSINLTEALEIPVLNPVTTLPNGTTIPVLGVNPAKWITIPIANNSTSQVYLNLDVTNKKAAMGYTLSSDQLGSNVTGNFFLGFNGGNVLGLAGIYSGMAKGQSGFALFADVSSLVANLGTRSLASTPEASKITFKDTTSSQKQIYIQKRMYELNNQRTVLKFK